MKLYSVNRKYNRYIPDIYVYTYICIYVYINIPGMYTKQRKSTTKLAYKIIYKRYNIIQEMRFL